MALPDGNAAAGRTVADLEVLRQVGGGLKELGSQLGDTLRAVDTLPVEAVGAVLGPVGAEFLSALRDATRRHRTVLASLSDVAGAAGDLVLATGETYADTDSRTAASLRVDEV